MKTLADHLKRLSIHPFLFAALSVMFTYSQIKEHALIEEIVPFLIGLEIAVLVVFVIMVLLLKSTPKAALVTTFILIATFCFKIYASCVDGVWAGFGAGMEAPPWISLATFAFGLFIWSSFMIKDEWRLSKKIGLKVDHESWSSSLNLVSAILILINAPGLISYAAEESEIQKKYIARFYEPFEKVHLNQSADKPDIYYLIVDQCANPKTLKDFWNYDNKEFVQYLKNKGFYLPQRAFSNYDRTSLSLSSSLNCQYIDAIPAELGKNWSRTTLLYRMTQDSVAVKMFKRLGYKFVNVFSGTAGTSFPPNADVNVMTTWNSEYYTMMLRFTPLHAIEKYYPVLRNWYADTRLGPGKALDKVMSVPGPKFVLIHCTLTHAPYIFGADGSPRELSMDFCNELGPPENYVNQVRYSEGVVREWIDKMLNQQKQPVLIVQADHGPFFPMPPLHYYNERMRILNAYYLPGKGNKGLYPEISPVNSFRVVLNDYFGANLPMLKDSAFCAPYDGNAFDWEDVTDKLVFGSDQVPPEEEIPIDHQPHPNSGLQ